MRATGVVSKYIESTAVFDDTQGYRYTLSRRWAQGGPTIMFVGLNPSTADAYVDDPTVRREVAYAKRWGYSKLLKGNIFAWRSTDPMGLREVVDPVGPANDEALVSMAEEADRLIVCWGAHGTYNGRGRTVIDMLREFEPFALKITKGGQPAHPLYLRGDLEPFKLP